MTVAGLLYRQFNYVKLSKTPIATPFPRATIILISSVLEEYKYGDCEPSTSPGTRSQLSAYCHVKVKEWADYTECGKSMVD